MSKKVQPVVMYNVLVVDIIARAGIDSTRWPKIAQSAFMFRRTAVLRFALTANKRNRLVAKLIVELHQRAKSNDPSPPERRQGAIATG